MIARATGTLAGALTGLVLLAMAPPGASAQTAASEGATPVAAEKVVVLQGLNKVTARISNFEAPLNVPVRFGTLEIVARTCNKRPPEETPETSAFLEISDVKADEAGEAIFTGWMFASSPALSALEHPVYDVWVADCKASAPDNTSGER